ncbi:MAG: insulinase family protein [Spirochaetaceae bacterium]|nr:insulinase family protein [Spirochaetaceae bacterium]
MKKNIYVVMVLIFAIASFSYAQVGFQEALHRYRLENGLSVFLLPEQNQAMVTMKFIVKSGYIHQTKEDAGFIPLFTKLFFDNIDFDFENYGIDVSVECSSNASVYTLSFLPEFTERIFSIVAEKAFEPTFLDSSIRKEVQKFSSELSTFYASSTGFINRQIESCVTGTETWQNYSGINPDIFLNKTAGELREKLYQVAQRYYIPSNCGLLVSAPLSKLQLEKIIQDTFEHYPFEKNILASQNIFPIVNTHTDSAFVLVSPDFSNELNQLVIQFPAVDFEQNIAVQVVAEFLNSKNAEKLSAISSYQETGILSEYYISATTANWGISRRLVIQALSDTSCASGASQIQALIDALKTEVVSALGSKDFQTAAKSVLYFEQSFDTVADYMEYVAKEFASSTLDLDQRFDDFSMQKISQSAKQIIESQPFAFILMNDKVFETQKQELETAGFGVIHHESVQQSTQESLQQNIVNDPKEVQEDSTLYSDWFLKEHLQSIKQVRLSNGIPLIHFNSSNRNKSAIRIEIAGGERSAFRGMYGIETLLVRCLTSCITSSAATLFYDGQLMGMPEISCETGLEFSYITIVCQQKDFQKCMQLAAHSIVFGDITPIVADEVFYNIQSEYKIAIGDTNFQMYCAAMKEIFNDTVYHSLFNLNRQPLEEMTYDSVITAQTFMFDASRYSIVTASSETIDQVLALSEQSFGALSVFPDISGLSVGYSPGWNRIIPRIISTKHYIHLNRIFLTDIPAHLAGERPAKLIPTTEFNDPVHYYTYAPTQKEKIPLFNALLYEIKFRLNTYYEKNVQIKTASMVLPLGGIQFQGVSSQEDIDSVLYEVLKQLHKELTNQNVIQGIKAKWIAYTFGGTFDNSEVVALIGESLEKGESAINYIEEFKWLESASTEDFVFIMKEFFLEAEPLCIYSESRLR